MSNITNYSNNELILLEKSWKKFADIGIEVYNYRETLKQLSRPTKKETHEEFEKRKWLLDKTEKSLKNQFLYRILDNEFLCFGVDLTHQLNKKVIELPSSIFNPQVEGFDISWKNNSLIAQGFRVSEIELKPNWPVINKLWACEAKPNYPLESNSTSVASKPNLSKQGGRPNSRRKVEDLLNEIVSNHDEAFFQLPNRTEQAREIRARLLGEKYRDKDNYTEFSTDSIKRWIGTKLKTS